MKGGTVFPPYYLNWDQTMVEGMEIMEASFKRSHVPTSTLSASNPAAGHHQPTPSPETPGHSQARSWSRTDLWRPIRPSRTNTQKRCPFHYRGLECKSRKIRNTWSNRQIWPWGMEWSRAKAKRVLPRERTGLSKHPLPTTKRRLYTWTLPDAQYQNQIDYIICSQRWRSSIQSAKTRPGADSGSDHELLIVRTLLWRLPWWSSG